MRISSHAEQEKPKVSSAFLRNQGYKRNECDASPLPVSNFCWQMVLSEIPLSPRPRTIAGPAATNTMEGRLMLNTSSDLCKQVVFQICQLVSNFAEFEAAKTEALTYGDTSRHRSGPDVPRRFSRRWQWKINYQTFALHFSQMRSNSIAMLGYQIQYQMITLKYHQLHHLYDSQFFSALQKAAFTTLPAVRSSISSISFKNADCTARLSPGLGTSFWKSNPFGQTWVNYFT